RGHLRAALVEGGFGLAVATTAESRPAPGREFVDLGRSLVQVCTHGILLESPDVGSMVRLTRSRRVNQRRYRPVPPAMQCDQKKIRICLFRGQSSICPAQGQRAVARPRTRSKACGSRAERLLNVSGMWRALDRVIRPGGDCRENGRDDVTIPSLL